MGTAIVKQITECFLNIKDRAATDLAILLLFIHPKILYQSVEETSTLLYLLQNYSQYLSNGNNLSAHPLLNG